MAATITCYGGVNEIGGNKLLLEDGVQRYLFDFGLNFDRLGTYYNEFLKTRPGRGLLDPLLLGLIPPLRGIYRTDSETETIWERTMQTKAFYRDLRRSDRAVDALFLSHAHLDHNGDISYLDPSMPIVSSKLTAFISRVVQVTGASTADREIVYANPRVMYETGLFGSDAKADYLLRPFLFCDGELSPEAAAFWLEAGAGSKKSIDDFCQSVESPPQVEIPYRFWPVDHSIPGACGLAVQSTAGWIGYTGDIRFHGKNGALTTDFAEALAGLGVKALLCEGTHPDPNKIEVLYESDIAELAVGIIEDYGGKLVMADFAAPNLERLMTFLEVAGETGRMLLVQPKDIYLLEACLLADPVQYGPALASQSLGMLTDPKSSPRGWEKDVCGRWYDRTVSHSDVSLDPGRYILAVSLWDLNDLPDLEGITGGAYLFSNSKAYDEEQKADLDRMRAWIKWIGMDIYGDPKDEEGLKLHSSGHAGYHQLVDFVKTVNPEILIPVHTENPAWWKNALAGTDIEIRPPEMGVPIEL